MEEQKSIMPQVQEIGVESLRTTVRITNTQKMKPLRLAILIPLFLPILCPAQTLTFRADSVGRHNWQITTISTFVRADSSTYETRASEVFRTRALARQHVRQMMGERITADSAKVEDTKRSIALLKASRAALLSDLARPSSAPRESAAPVEVPKAVLPETTKKPAKKKKQ